MGRSDYILGKIQLIFTIPINLQNFLEMPSWWACVLSGFWFTLCPFDQLTFIIISARE